MERPRVSVIVRVKVWVSIRVGKLTEVHRRSSGNMES